MKRRTVLSGTACWLSAVGGGCLSRLTGGCPTPDLGDELPYEEHDAGQLLGLGREGAVLLAEAGDIDRLDDRWLTADERRRIDRTAFSRDAVLGVQVGSSSQSSDLEIRGVERDADTVHAYSCIADSGGTDDWAAYARLLRVPHGGVPPGSAVLTHWERDHETTYG